MSDPVANKTDRLGNKPLNLTKKADINSEALEHKLRESRVYSSIAFRDLFCPWFYKHKEKICPLPMICHVFL
jgi:hypothetical protein